MQCVTCICMHVSAVCVWCVCVFSKLFHNNEHLARRPCPLSKAYNWRDKHCWVKQPVFGGVGGAGRARMEWRGQGP